MPRARRTLRCALHPRVALAALATLGLFAMAARQWAEAPLTAELCRLALPLAECVGSSQAEHTPDVYQQRDLWLAEESLFDQEQAAFEVQTAGAADNAATQPTRSDLALLNAADLLPAAGPEADEDEMLWLAPHPSIELALEWARWQELHSPSQPTAPGSSLAAAAPVVSSGSAGVGVFPPAVRTRNRRYAVAERRSALPVATATAIFRLGYFSARNGYAGRDTAATLRQVTPACPSGFARAPHPAPLSVIVPTTVTTSPEFLV